MILPLAVHGGYQRMARLRETVPVSEYECEGKIVRSSKHVAS